VLTPLGQDFHTLIQDPLEKAGSAVARFFHIPQDTGLENKIRGAAGATNELGVSTELVSKLLPPMTAALETEHKAVSSAWPALDKLTQSTTVFGKTADVVAQWRTSTASNLNFVEQNMADLGKNAKLSASDVIKAFDAEIVQMGKYRENFDVLVARNAPQKLLKQLADMGQQGAPIVAALAGANATQFKRIVDDWNKANRKAPGVFQDIQNAFTKAGPIKIPLGFDTNLAKKNVRAAKQDLLDQLGGKLTVDATATFNVQAVTMNASSVFIKANPKQAGGPVGAHEPLWVGEKGPELFVPNTSGTIVPHGSSVAARDVDRLIAAIEAAVSKQRPINVTEATNPIVTANAIAARIR
jgi:hypothetical protein